MAAFTLDLNDHALGRLTEAARAAGVTPERLAKTMLESWIASGGADHHSPGVGEPASAWRDEAVAQPGESDPSTTPKDYEGPFVELDEALDGFSAELKRRLQSPTG